MKKNIVVLDTETTGELGSPLIYDFGYQIVNLEGGVILEKNYIVAEIFDNKSLMAKAFYSDKVGMYRQKIENGEIEKKSYKKIITEFVNDCKRSKVEIVSAYNLAFDVRAINSTLQVCYHEKFISGWFEKFVNQKNKKLLCIWNLACETILDTDEYRNFATENEKVSTKGNYKTNAEVAYQFITGELDFVEEHTALSDVKIEVVILLNILKNYSGNITYGTHYGSWRKVQRKS